MYRGFDRRNGHLNTYMIPTEIDIEKYLLVEALVGRNNAKSFGELVWYHNMIGYHKSDITRLDSITKRNALVEVEKHLAENAKQKIIHSKDPKVRYYYRCMMNHYNRNIESKERRRYPRRVRF